LEEWGTGFDETCTQRFVQQKCDEKAEELCATFLNSSAMMPEEFPSFDKSVSKIVAIGFLILLALHATYSELRYAKDYETDDLTKTNEIPQGSIRWWDINFMEQEMEDMYRKVSRSVDRRFDCCLPISSTLALDPFFFKLLLLTSTLTPTSTSTSPNPPPADGQPRQTQ
jgi:hypothetical protein